MRTILPLFAILLPALSCAPAYDDIPVKLVGVGYDPDEIGPAPTPYGGVVEYSWVNFAGGGLSLALMGLGSFDEVGPNMSGYSPPYAAVYGFSYVFDTKLAAADSLGGVTSVPPPVDDSCYTTFDASGPIGSFKTVDVGSWMKFATGDGEGGMQLDRIPGDYPPDEQDLFVYYSSVDYWAAQPIYGLVPKGDSDRPDRMDSVLLRQRNFPFGETVAFSFPGALARQEAPIGSLPRPSAAVGNTEFELPIPGDFEQPQGRRAPTACEDDGEWVFDDAYEDANGNLAPVLRGDPFNNVSELTCRLADDGEFTLTEAQLEDALTYARSRGAQGVVFYLARSTEVEAKIPPAMDQYRQKLDISPIKVTSRAIDIGRFWLEE